MYSINIIATYALYNRAGQYLQIVLKTAETEPFTSHIVLKFISKRLMIFSFVASI